MRYKEVSNEGRRTWFCYTGQAQQGNPAAIPTHHHPEPDMLASAAMVHLKLPWVLALASQLRLMQCCNSRGYPDNRPHLTFWKARSQRCFRSCLAVGRNSGSCDGQGGRQGPVVS